MKSRIEMCFIVLHYLDKTLTEQTVDSLFSLERINKSRIIIVDNASPNNSGKELEIKYKNHKNVIVLLNNINMGFSYGNNVGYEYYLKHFEADFVVATNNDVIFNQSDFIQIVYKCYRSIPFHVAGPDIYIPYRHVHQNPICGSVRTLVEINEAIKEGNEFCKKLNKPISLTGIQIYIREKYPKLKMTQCLFDIKHKFDKKNKLWQEEKKDVVLFGACLIFSRKYCKENTFLFEPLTFMYGEEDFLALRCHMMKYVSLYTPQIQVIHFSQGSSQLTKKTYRELCNQVISNRKKCVEAYSIYKKLYLQFLER